MALPIEFLSEAEQDILTIRDYVSQRNPQASAALMRLIRQRVKTLPTNPNTGRKGLVTGTRKLVISHNYIVVYRIETQRILILRIRHAAQHWTKS